MIIGIEKYKKSPDATFANLDAKYLPVVYGVGKIPGIPIFVDTLNSDNSVIFTAYALSEGEIGGIYDIHFDGTPSVCIDENDFDIQRFDLGQEMINQLSSNLIKISAKPIYFDCDFGHSIEFYDGLIFEIISK